MRREPISTLNSNTGRKILINGVHFLNLLKHGLNYDEKLNRLFDNPFPLNTPKYIPKSRVSLLIIDI